jgi:hypothetical protein
MYLKKDKTDDFKMILTADVSFRYYEYPDTYPPLLYFYYENIIKI